MSPRPDFHIVVTTVVQTVVSVLILGWVVGIGLFAWAWPGALAAARCPPR